MLAALEARELRRTAKERRVRLVQMPESLFQRNARHLREKGSLILPLQRREPPVRLRLGDTLRTLPESRLLDAERPIKCEPDTAERAGKVLALL